MSAGVRRGLEALFLTGVAIALWFALVVAPPTFGFSALPFQSDHVMHAVTFLVLTFLGAWLWAPIVLFGGIMIGAGGLLEIAQWPVGRDMELGDWFASSVGVAIGAVIFLTVGAGLSAARNR